jgi:hypothetical protein
MVFAFKKVWMFFGFADDGVPLTPGHACPRRRASLSLFTGPPVVALSGLADIHPSDLCKICTTDQGRSEIS